MKKGLAVGIGVAIAVAAIAIAFGVSLSTSPDTEITESLTETSENTPPSQGRVIEVHLSDGVSVDDKT